MQVIIETPIVFEKMPDNIWQILKNDYFSILQDILICGSEDVLHKYFHDHKPNFFEVGFGGHHMWVKQVNRNGKLYPDRLILVRFDDVDEKKPHK